MSGSQTVATVRTMTTRACLCGILLATATLSAGGSEPMTVTVSPAVAFAPATLIVRAKIEADVVGDRAREQERILQHHAQLPAIAA